MSVSEISPSTASATEPGIALVLAGGGVLGAYEAGVLRYVQEDLADEIGRAPRFNFFAGTSIGALNACILASRTGLEPRQASDELVRYWQSLRFDRVLRFGRPEAAALLRLVTGRSLGQLLLRAQLPRPSAAPHPPVAGLFDNSRMQGNMAAMVSRQGLREGFATGRLRGLALCATEVCTGKGVVFYQTADGFEYHPGRNPIHEPRRVELGPQHALASSALPFLFPSVQIDGTCFTDGALRQNTPLSPVLRMGAERVMVISVTQEPSLAARAARIGCRRNPYPGALFLLGKTANVLLAQSLDHDLNRLHLVNRLIADGIAIYGPGYLDNLNRLVCSQRNAPYRLVRTCHLRPSRDLHRLALRALADAPGEMKLPGLGGRFLTWLLGSVALGESELLSYLLFTPTFIRRLLDLGYRDAREHRKELLRFFSDEPADQRLAAG